jgi:hypothetical protein
VHVTHDQLQHLVLVSKDQQIERRPLTPLDALDQFKVALLNGHLRAPTSGRANQPVAVDRPAKEKFGG